MMRTIFEAYAETNNNLVLTMEVESKTRYDAIKTICENLSDNYWKEDTQDETLAQMAIAKLNAGCYMTEEDTLIIKLPV